VPSPEAGVVEDGAAPSTGGALMVVGLALAGEGEAARAGGGVGACLILECWAGADVGRAAWEG